VAVELAMGGLAVAVGRQVVPIWGGVLAGGLLLVALSVVTSRASVYTEHILGLPAPLLAGAAVGAGAIVVLAAISGGLRGQATLGQLGASEGLARVSIAVAGLAVAATLLTITRMRRESLDWTPKEPSLSE
jgi:hypothetical protein